MSIVLVSESTGMWLKTFEHQLVLKKLVYCGKRDKRQVKSLQKYQKHGFFGIIWFIVSSFPK